MLCSAQAGRLLPAVLSPGKLGCMCQNSEHDETAFVNRSPVDHRACHGPPESVELSGGLTALLLLWTLFYLHLPGLERGRRPPPRLSNRPLSTEDA